MDYSLDRVIRDFLALRGESPDLLPLLEEGEESAVLTLARELQARLPAAAIEATLAVPPLYLDELKSSDGMVKLDMKGYGVARMPPDYLKLYSLRMQDWKEPVREVEPMESLRWALGANAPSWMICPHRPMVVEERDADGIFLKIYGSSALSSNASILYVPLPCFDGETLTMSRAAYLKMMQLL